MDSSSLLSMTIDLTKTPFKMTDPFKPLRSLAISAGLAHLPENVHRVVASFAFFAFLHLVAAPILSRALAPRVYTNLSRRGKNTWNIHIVSQAHVLIIVPLALWTMAGAPELAQDKAFGWSEERVGLLTSVASGYFLWDTLDAIINFTSVGFVLHGFVALCIFVGSFRPFVAFFTTRCLLWELSTFFLNVHWFCDKTGMTGSKLQLINGLCLLSTFFAVRVVFGGMYITPRFTVVLWSVRDQLPPIYTVIFLGGNTCLTSLNVFWFYKMLQAIRKRFPEGQSTTTKQDDVQGDLYSNLVRKSGFAWLFNKIM
ncbi:hypothetical protein CYLTODRAFT_417226 [Cylindrobasidium torrendii FP15055 ss-10]|uniref:TLC domain-containing protein n=1 Tax=Cylindrobasidium torrendii FP15055 ss-10 TaxID=1314674 RepID=A0A0D7BUH8_9AGAR|nr:hypothetical protein CYLTODRAFT_417226 [Cylindrobasidium torrendii FP15055 ss-10]